MFGLYPRNQARKVKSKHIFLSAWKHYLCRVLLLFLETVSANLVFQNEKSWMDFIDMSLKDYGFFSMLFKSDFWWERERCQVTPLVH